MRVVGGIFKGRTLREFSKIGVRPTSDMARESLFNIIRERVINCVFLDLFSGTGAVGIEALSRGAREVHFNDQSKESQDLIKSNLEKIKAQFGFVIHREDGICLLENSCEKFDIVFIDPPYQSDLKERALSKVGNALKSGGIAISEDQKPYNEKQYNGLKFYDQRRYGRAFLNFFVKEE